MDGTNLRRKQFGNFLQEILTLHANSVLPNYYSREFDINTNSVDEQTLTCTNRKHVSIMLHLFKKMTLNSLNKGRYTWTVTSTYTYVY